MTNIDLNGGHLIAGHWVQGDTEFSSAPLTGPALQFQEGNQQHIEQAAQAAEDAFLTFGWTKPKERAELLRVMADEIEDLGDAITHYAMAETGLPEARLVGERGRTVGQLRLFADMISQEDFLEYRHDDALPDRAPLPRPDLKMVQRPIGPVAVFGASNFPLAFSTAGGDTAAALAAGCPVIFKGHPAHPATGALVATALGKAIEKTAHHPGVFSFIQGSGHEVGGKLVQHPLIRAVGFTGSLAGGRALFDLCAARPEPIPFFGELGSINPMFLLPEAMSARTEAIASGWAASLTMGAGQFCTNPGIAVLLKSDASEHFTSATIAALEQVSAQPTLTDGIADMYRQSVQRIAENECVTTLLNQQNSGRAAVANLFHVTGDVWLSNPELHHEVFGPSAIIVEAESEAQMLDIARHLDGQLTCTVHMDNADTKMASGLVPILERKAGRLLVNGFPTGVEVASAMVHGGPYPASTNFGATSVGTMAIRRFLRPVCYQNFPDALLPM